MPCKLDRAQCHTVARALADIRHLRRIQAPIQRFSQRGAPNQEVMTGKFLLDLSSTHLPLNVFSHLLHLAKTAASLCGACGQALEADEPFFGNRGGHRARTTAAVDNFSARPTTLSSRVRREDARRSERHAAGSCRSPWKTASTLFPSGSMTNAA